MSGGMGDMGEGDMGEGAMGEGGMGEGTGGEQPMTLGEVPLDKASRVPKGSQLPFVLFHLFYLRDEDQLEKIGDLDRAPLHPRASEMEGAGLFFEVRDAVKVHLKHTLKHVDARYMRVRDSHARGVEPECIRALLAAEEHLHIVVPAPVLDPGPDAFQELQRAFEKERQEKLVYKEKLDVSQKKLRVAEINLSVQARTVSNYSDKGKALKERLHPNKAYFETVLTEYDGKAAENFLAAHRNLVTDWKRMVENKSTREKDLQELMGRLLPGILATRGGGLERLYYHDTSETPLVGGAKPDVVLANVEGRPCAAHVVTVFEFKKDLSTDGPLDECRGESEYRVFQLKRQQPDRHKFIFVVMGRSHIQVLEFPRDGVDGIECLPQHDFALDANNAGFQDLWRLLHTPSKSLGFKAPHLPSFIEMEEGHLSFQAALMASATRSQEGVPVRTTSVYLGKLMKGDPRTSRPMEVVVKVPGTPEAFKEELLHLKLVSLKKEWPTVKLVGEAVKVNGNDGFVLHPVGRPISYNITVKLLRQVMGQAASFVGDYHDVGMKFHRDLSLHNLAITDDGKVVVFDFQTSRGVAEKIDGDPTGTRIYMALSIMEERKPSVSSELESLAYVALDVLTANHLPWRGSDRAVDETEKDFRAREVQVRLQAMLSFKGVLEHVRKDGTVFAQSLRDLFFGNGYKDDVTVEEFKSCCCDSSER